MVYFRGGSTRCCLLIKSISQLASFSLRFSPLVFPYSFNDVYKRTVPTFFLSLYYLSPFCTFSYISPSFPLFILFPLLHFNTIVSPSLPLSITATQCEQVLALNSIDWRKRGPDTLARTLEKRRGKWEKVGRLRRGGTKPERVCVCVCSE